MKTKIGRFVYVAGITVALALTAHAADADVYAQIAGYDSGKSRAALAAFEVEVRNAGSAGYGGIEQGLLRVLQTPDATFAGKQFACQMLRLVGSEKCVPVVARLLPDEKLSHMARVALEALPGDAAGQALLAAMNAAAGNVKVGLIGSLGARGDERAVPELGKLLAAQDPGVARAAILALGRIGGEAAATALNSAKVAKELETIRMQSWFLCLRTMAANGKESGAAKLYRKVFDESTVPGVRIPALRGIVSIEKDQTVPLLLELIAGRDATMARAAQTTLVEIPGKNVGRMLATKLPQLAPPAQLAVLEVLAGRADDAAGGCAQVNALAQSQNADVRMAALKCLGTVGDASSVDVLVAALGGGGETGKTARASLDRLHGADVDKNILQRMAAADEALCGALIQSLAQRRAVTAVPVLLDMAEGKDGALRNEALKALGSLAGDAARPRLYGILKEHAGDKAVDNAVYEACVRQSNRDGCIDEITAAFAAAGVPARCAMIQIVGRLGGGKALQIVSAAFDNASEEMRKSATKALADWSDTDDLVALLSLARNAGDNKHLRSAVIAGWLRLVRFPSNRKPDETIKLYRTLLDVPMETAEKKQIFVALGGLRHEDAMTIVMAGLDDRECGDAAAESVLKLAEALNRSHPALVKSALTKVLAVSKNEDLKKDATAKLAGMDKRN